MGTWELFLPELMNSDSIFSNLGRGVNTPGQQQYKLQSTCLVYLRKFLVA